MARRTRNNVNTRMSEALIAEATKHGSHPAPLKMGGARIAGGKVVGGVDNRHTQLLSAAATAWLKGNREPGDPRWGSKPRPMVGDVSSTCGAMSTGRNTRA